MASRPTGAIPQHLGSAARGGAAADSSAIPHNTSPRPFIDIEYIPTLPSYFSGIRGQLERFATKLLRAGQHPVRDSKHNRELDAVAFGNADVLIRLVARACPCPHRQTVDRGDGDIRATISD